jgi:hypothetical protein
MNIVGFGYWRETEARGILTGARLWSVVAGIGELPIVGASSNRSIYHLFFLWFLMEPRHPRQLAPFRFQIPSSIQFFLTLS